MILAGDIGGTKTLLALFDVHDGALQDVRESSFASHDFPSLESMLGDFLRAAPVGTLHAACFGVAGPVVDGRVHTTNLPWVLDARSVGHALHIERVKLMNDLEATAYGMLHLAATDVVVLSPGSTPRRVGNIGVIAAGTGLGEAMLYWDGQRHHPIASEGGHADFAPRTDEQIELLRSLRRRFDGHVSYERVLSGPGLFNIYCFLRDRGATAEAAAVAAELDRSDPNAVIAEAGLRGDPLSRAALDMFCSLYGAEAGNLALRCVAVGGVFVAGGIAPKIVSALTAGGFVDAFVDKGRFADLLRSIPVQIAMNPRAALLGAAHTARQL